MRFKAICFFLRALSVGEFLTNLKQTTFNLLYLEWSSCGGSIFKKYFKTLQPLYYREIKINTKREMRFKAIGFFLRAFSIGEFIINLK